MLEGTINAELKKASELSTDPKDTEGFGAFFMQKRDGFVDFLLEFIKQGAGKEPCQRDSKGTGACAVFYTQLRNCERAYGSTK